MFHDDDRFFPPTSGKQEKAFDKRLKTGYTVQAFKIVIRFPCSWGGGGALYLQSAIVGVISRPGPVGQKLPCISGVDVWVLRNRNL